MAEYREIITKAVVAKGRKFTQSTNTVKPPQNPSSILGCWIINHKYVARKVNKKVEIVGSFEINLWFSHSDNTKTSVVTEKVEYVDEIKLHYLDPDSLSDKEVVARVLQQPNCIEAVISPNGNKVLVNVEREYLVEIIGETKVVVHVNPDGITTDDDEWENEFEDEFESLNPEFLLASDEEE